MNLIEQKAKAVFAGTVELISQVMHVNIRCEAHKIGITISVMW